ncbi:hypothetical protein [Microbacterium oxydans]|nr:hypothetical protein [Microbacterium oxydans]WAA65316.1 hypothetical protein MME74_13900 [Microbacterium oxydans]
METEASDTEEPTLSLPMRMLLRLLAHVGVGLAIALFLSWPWILLAGWRE